MKSCLWIAGLWCCTQALAATEPTPALIQSTQRAITQCQLQDPALLLDADWLAGLARLQADALYADADYDREMLLPREVLIVSELRRSQRYDTADIYAVSCRWTWPAEARTALRQMRAADPIVVEQVAFVPLLTASGDYLGTGFAYVMGADGWRFTGWESTVLAARVRDRGLAEALQTEYEWDPDLSMNCPPPPAPMARLDYLPVEINVPFYDEANALGAAERLAARTQALGLRGPASDTSRMLLAEIYLRSLRFEQAPVTGSPSWARRVEHAEVLIQSLEHSDLDWTPLAPVLQWLSRVRLQGVGAVNPDPTLAARYRALARKAGGVDVVEDENALAEPLTPDERSAPPLRRPTDLPKRRPPCPQA